MEPQGSLPHSQVPATCPYGCGRENSKHPLRLWIFPKVFSHETTNRASIKTEVSVCLFTLKIVGIISFLLSIG